MTNELRLYSMLFYLIITVTGVKAQMKNEDPLYNQTSEVNNVMVQYNADYNSVERFYGNSGYFFYGADSYVLSSFPERREKLLSIVNQYIQQLHNLDFDKLNTGTKVDYILFDRNLKEEQYQLQKEKKEYFAVQQWFPFADTIYTFEKYRSRGAVPDAPQIAAAYNNIVKNIKQLQQKLDKINFIEIELGERAEDIIKGLRNAIKSCYDFYNGYDPLYTWWVPNPYVQLDSALRDYAKTFKSKEHSITPQADDGTGIVGNPIGEDGLKRKLQYEMVDYSPDELIAIANKEFAWCDTEMLKASREMGFGNNWKAALEKVKNTYVAPGEQPAAMLKLYDESVNFIKQHDLITFPELGLETWRMRMMTPKQQLVNPFFTGGETLSISYPTNTMTQDDKMMSMRGNNPHFSHATVHHELFAGHALQEFITSRYKTYRHFETPFWIEGWSLYWEMLLWNMNFNQTPEDKIGMLFWRMHRCARIIFTINYHTGKWTPKQCIDFLVDRVGFERANAEGEVRRSFASRGYDPLYQIAYMIGGLQIMSLKKELVDSGKMTYKQFHDSFLQQNMMPIEMTRAILENQPLTKDYKTQWKFYSFK